MGSRAHTAQQMLPCRQAAGLASLLMAAAGPPPTTEREREAQEREKAVGERERTVKGGVVAACEGVLGKMVRIYFV